MDYQNQISSPCDLNLAYRKGLRVLFIVGGGLAAAATLIIIFPMPQFPLDRPDDEKPKEEGKTADEESRGLSAADQATHMQT